MLLGLVHLAGIIPGPAPKNQQTFLQPMMDELLMMWGGFEVDVYETEAATGPLPQQQPPEVTRETHNIHAMLVHIIGDYPGMYGRIM